MATLINGDGNLAIAAAQDADWFASIMGNQTSITGVGHQFAAEVISATEIALSDGVIITKEGRRIQLDADQIDTFDIPAGGADITNYYIIGYYLYRDGDSNELCEPFVELMDSSTATIEEDTFKGGADEVFVSLYRVTFTEFAISNVQALLPSIDSIRQITTSIGQINNDLSGSWQLQPNSRSVTLTTANGVKTVSQLMSDALTTLRSLTIPSGYGWKLMDIRIPVSTTGRQQFIILPEGIRTAFSSTTNILGYAIVARSTGVLTFAVNLNSGYVHQMSNATYTDLGTIVPDNGLTIELWYELYKRIN